MQFETLIQTLLQESRLQPVNGRTPAEAGTPKSEPYGGACPGFSRIRLCPPAFRRRKPGLPEGTSGLFSHRSPSENDGIMIAC